MCYNIDAMLLLAFIEMLLDVYWYLLGCYVYWDVHLVYDMANLTMQLISLLLNES